MLFGCSETTFLINSAKRIGSWGDEPLYKVGNPYKINGKWYYPAVDYQYDEIRGTAQDFMEDQLLMEKYLTRIKFPQLTEHFPCHRL